MRRARPALLAVPAALAAAALALGLAACPAPGPKTATYVAKPPPPVPHARTYHATVRWTSDGVPHVTAEDWASLGFGQGWAVAGLHLCDLEDQIVRVRGERSRFFGPGDDGANLDSDFFHLHMGYLARAHAAIDHLSPEARAIGHGFVRGFDYWLAHHPPATWPEPCRGAAWVRPLTDDDLVANALALATTASSRALIPLIARAAPRGPTAMRPHLPAPDATLASNGWAIGAERTASGGGLVVGNPHFPWEGALRFTEVQLTIPGQLDVYGAGLIGSPLVNIGFTKDVAWTHTFSSSVHFVVYRVPLSKDAPLRIDLGDVHEPIAPATYTIQVRQPDGSLHPEKRTLYRTRWGPMLDSAELPWDPATGHAFTLDDVALDDAGAMDLYLALARAHSVDDVARALDASHTPFVNTIAADVHGDALYVDGSRVPALSEDGLLAWTLGRKVVPALEKAWKRGVVVLDAANPAFALAGDARGAIPMAHAPHLERRDWVVNANDPYTFTHPGVAMPAASPLYGDAAAPSPRTLANWALLAGDAKLDHAAAARLLFANRSFTADRLRDLVVAACRRAPPPPAPRRHGRRRPATRPATPPLARACEALAGWNGTFSTDARGAALWRETLVELSPAGHIPWAHPYDPADPTTPSGLAATDAQVQAAVRAAWDRLAAAGLDPTAPLGALQHTRRGDATVGVPGGTQLDGVADVVAWADMNGTMLPRDQRGATLSPSGLTAHGYPVNFGTSFVMAVDLTPAGPTAGVLLTYGNSGDPASPHFRDQLDAFARGQLRPARFTAAQVAADPGVTTDELTDTEAPTP